jgi:hypothetical protein
LGLELDQDEETKEFKFILRKEIDDILETFGVRIPAGVELMDYLAVSDSMEIFICELE